MNPEYKNIIHSVVVPASLSREEQNKRYQPFFEFLQAEMPEKLYRFRSCTEWTIDEFDQNKLGFAPVASIKPVYALCRWSMLN